MRPRATIDSVAGLRTVLRPFCEKHRLRRLDLFGSAARGEATADSDVDLLVEFEPGVRIGLMGLAQLELDLSQLIGRPVDLNTPGGLHSRFRDRVLAEAEVVYAA